MKDQDQAPPAPRDVPMGNKRVAFTTKTSAKYEYMPWHSFAGHNFKMPTGCQYSHIEEVPEPETYEVRVTMTLGFTRLLRGENIDRVQHGLPPYTEADHRQRVLTLLEAWVDNGIDMYSGKIELQPWEDPREGDIVQVCLCAKGEAADGFEAQVEDTSDGEIFTVRRGDNGETEEVAKYEMHVLTRKTNG